MIKLFVGGFPLEMSEIDLVKLFNLHGDVVTIKIVRDKKTKICKGYAFLEMKDQESADNAIAALDGYEIGDRSLTVKIRSDEPVAPVKPAFNKYSNYSSRPKPSYHPTANTNAVDPARKKRPRKVM